MMERNINLAGHTFLIKRSEEGALKRSGRATTSGAFSITLRSDKMFLVRGLVKSKFSCVDWLVKEGEVQKYLPRG